MKTSRNDRRRCCGETPSRRARRAYIPASRAALRSRPGLFRSLLPAAAIGVAGALVATAPVASQARTAGAPLTLGQVLESVAARHPLVEAARSRVRAARGARITAGALGNPVLAYQVENARLPGGEAPPMEREAMTTATLPLEPLYQRAPRVRSADAAIRAAEADASAERQRVALDAARAYYRTAAAQVAVEAARDLASWLDTVVAYNRTRVTEGVAAEADLIRSELERDRAAADATMQEADLVRARADLASFLGDASTEFSQLTVAIDESPLVLPVGLLRPHPSASPALRAAGVGVADAGGTDDTARAALISRALAARPEMRAARARLAAAGAGIATERRMLVRQLGAMLGTKQSAGTTSLIAGVSAPLPLFDQNRGEIARAAAERDAAAFDLAAEERAVRAEVAAAYEAARLLTERARVLSRASAGSPGYLARADEARRIALGAYREGAVPLIQVIDAARAWGEARVAFYRTLYAQHESVLALVAAQGADIIAALPAAASRGGEGAAGASSSSQP